MISILDLEVPRHFARREINSAFAAPSTGGEVSLTFRAPSKAPTISLRDERGKTFTVSRVHVFSWLLALELFRTCCNISGKTSVRKDRTECTIPKFSELSAR